MLHPMAVPAANPPEGEVTRCLHRLRAGDTAAASELLDLVYAELRRTAAAAMRGERAAHTLDPTALVHEAWLRLLGREARPFADRQHFLRAAARAMRRILIDHARARRRQKRGGTLDPHEPTAEWLLVAEVRQLDLLALDQALDQLALAAPDLAELVELRFFGGLSIAETAAATNRSTASVERDWRCARALLRRLIDGDAE
jgi:RNA polymerase sigma factor (TIGR02999 family)